MASEGKAVKYKIKVVLKSVLIKNIVKDYDEKIGKFLNMLQNR